MADLSKIVDSVLDVAEALAPLAGRGIPQAVVAARKAVELMERTKEIAQERDAARLDMRIAELRAETNRNVDEAIDRLEG